MKLYTCDCHTEGISFSVEKEDQNVYFSSWQLSPGKGSMTIRERIRWCWHILKTGKPFNDNFIFTFDTAKEFSEELLKDILENRKQ